MSASAEIPAPGQLYRTGWWFYLLLASAAVFWIGARENRIPLDLFLDVDRWWLDLGIGVAAGGGIVVGWNLLARASVALRELEERLGRMVGELDTSQAVSLAVISGFAEELFFRGAMQGSWGPLWATLIFGLLHTGPGPSFRLWTVFALLAGAVMAALTVWRGNILPAVVAHILVNGINLSRLASRGASQERPTLGEP